jgi:hypothetical protein
MTTTSITHPALEFLGLLDPLPNATFNIEHYTDTPKGVAKPRPDPLLGRYANLSLTEAEKLLQTLHATNGRGAGIFVSRNQCDGC